MQQRELYDFRILRPAANAVRIFGEKIKLSIIVAVPQVKL